MGSPFHSGAAGGAILEQTVYDFGRISSALQQAKAEKSLTQARLAEDKFRFLYGTGLLYLACARVRTLIQSDQQLMSWAQINLKETARYTRTGQRSVIDNSLVQTEVDKLQLEMDQLQKYQQSLGEQMKFYGVTCGCKGLDDSWSFLVPTALRVEEPSLLIAKAQMESSQAGYESAKSAQLPTIKVMGSVGDMNDARLVDKQGLFGGSRRCLSDLELELRMQDASKHTKFKLDTKSENLKAAELDS